MPKRRQVAAAIICAIILASLFVSSAYVAHEAAHPHDCAGADCPVCRFIAQVEQLCRGLGIALPALLLVCLAVAAGHGACPPGAAIVPARCTPVDRKIRLND